MKAHAGTRGNELADSIAKKAATNGTIPERNYSVSVPTERNSVIKNHLVPTLLLHDVELYEINIRVVYKGVFYFTLLIYLFFPVALRPNAGHGLLMFEVSRSHTTTHHSRQDSSARVISSSQRPLPDNTQHSQHTNIHAPRWDSNPRSQQASCRRPTP